MLEELQTLALVGLLVSTYYLTIGCRKIGDSLPDESGHISSRIDATSDKIGTMTEVLDDIANLLNEGLGALAGNRVESPSNPVEMILSSVISPETGRADDSRNRPVGLVENLRQTLRISQLVP